MVGEIITKWKHQNNIIPICVCKCVLMPVYVNKEKKKQTNKKYLSKNTVTTGSYH